MRVALLSYNAQARDAVGNHVFETASFFVESSADLRVFVQSTNNLHPGVEAHIQVVERVENTGRTWDFLCECDLVIFQFGQFYELLHFLPMLVDRKPRIVVDYLGVTPPCDWPAAQRQMLFRSQEARGLVWCADAVIVHSEFTRQELINATNFPTARIRHQGLAVAGHFGQSSPKRRLQQVLQLPSDARLLLCVGRLAVNKRVPVLIEALEHLRDLSPPVHAVHIGNAGDIYAEEFKRCRDRAEQLGVADRFHHLDPLDDDGLADAYRSSDLLVIPSSHEGFCMPVIEAMASGLPVLAARSSALPETIGDAGLTFTLNDSEDLARQARRVLKSTVQLSPLSPVLRGEGMGVRGAFAGDFVSSAQGPSGQKPRRRIAIVSFRFGADIVGGAERSLLVMGNTLQSGGHYVEVYTTCTRHESDWRNELPAGTTKLDGLTVHRYPIDPLRRTEHLKSVRAIVGGSGRVTPAQEQAYLADSIHSSALVRALESRLAEFDAIIVGPYLFGLTHEIASRLASKTLVVPCFHDEPLAWLKTWATTYSRVGGLLFHTPEEQRLAQTELGINHPNCVVVGTFLQQADVINDRLHPELPTYFSCALPSSPPVLRGRGDGGEGVSIPREIFMLLQGPCPPSPRPSPPGVPGGEGAETVEPPQKRYLVYCGRYSREKEVPRLIDYLRRYQSRTPGRFDAVFMGTGEVKIPHEPWAQNVGRVSEERKRELLGGAAALIQLSRQESLSLVALEAWQVATPVIVDNRCPVLLGQVRRAQGGRTICDFESFAAALDDLWEHGPEWAQLGRNGAAYVAEHYGSEEKFRARLETAVGNLSQPIVTLMRARGLDRALDFSRRNWRTAFGRIVEELLDGEPRVLIRQVDLHPQRREVRALLGQRSLLVPVRVRNNGSHPVASEGPGKTFLYAQVVGESPTVATALPSIILPANEKSLAVFVRLPQRAGDYVLRIWMGNAMNAWNSEAATVSLEVSADTGIDAHCTAPLLAAAQESLGDLQHLARLPDDYVDVTQGRLASVKRWIKRKLIGNFKNAYVDVLSRQQSQVNERLSHAVQQLAECCATLDHAVRQLQDRLDDRETEEETQEITMRTSNSHSHPR